MGLVSRQLGYAANPVTTSAIEPGLTPADWNACAQIARTHGRSFYFASRFLSPAKRRAVHSIYAYCRTADDIVDNAQCVESARQDLDNWLHQIDRPVDLIARAFMDTRQRFAIPAQPARDLIEGVGRDLQPTLFRTWPELRVYCHGVAGTVGLMVSPVLGCSDPAVLNRAAGLGIAMQLTNILRDVAEDAELGRLYLPTDELAAFGIDPESVLERRPNGSFTEFMQFQISRARELYDEARPGIPALPPASRLTTLAASHFYSGILCEIEALNYDVFSARAHVSSSKKVRSLPTIAASFVHMTVRSA